MKKYKGRGRILFFLLLKIDILHILLHVYYFFLLCSFYQFYHQILLRTTFLTLYPSLTLVTVLKVPFNLLLYHAFTGFSQIPEPFEGRMPTLPNPVL